MVEEEDDISLLDELNNLFKSKNTNFSEYTQENQKLYYAPDNPYAHQYSLISSKTGDVETKKWDVIDDPQIVLGDIDNEKTLRLYQTDFRLLVECCGLAQKDPMFNIVFNALWRIFKGELRMTSNMGGKERFFQAMMTPKSQARPGFSLLRKASSKKKKTMADYVFESDDEEGGGMY